MAATDITLDSLLRRDLAIKSLPLHYYVPRYIMARWVLDELHFDALHKIKTVVVTPNAGDMIDLPADCVDVIDLVSEVADKVKPLGINDAINPRLNQDTGVDIPFEGSSGLLTFEAVSYNLGSQILENFYDQNGNYRGRAFGRTMDFTGGYKVLRDLGKIRVDNRDGGTSYLLIYLSLPEKVSNQSVIHPYAKSTLLAGINWKFEESQKSKMTDYFRNEYYNELRKLKARMNPTDVTELVRVMRQNFRLSFKN